MRQVLKRDWEIVRIFLILAILTVGFVWGMQSLILTPTAVPHLQPYSQTGLTPADTDAHSEALALGKLGLFSSALSLPATVLEAPLRHPADASSEK